MLDHSTILAYFKKHNATVVQFNQIYNSSRFSVELMFDNETMFKLIPVIDVIKIIFNQNRITIEFAHDTLTAYIINRKLLE